MIKEIKKEIPVLGLKPKIKLQNNVPTSLPEILTDINIKLNIMAGTNEKLREGNLPLNLSSAAKKINAKLDTLIIKDKKGKVSRFQLRGKNKAKMKDWYKKKKLLVFLLGVNRSVSVHIIEIRDGYILIDGVPRKCTLDYIYLFEGKMPCIILPEWSLEPVGVEEYYKAHPSGLDAAAAQKMVIGAIESNRELLSGKSMSARTWIWIVIGVIVIGYILSGGA